MPKTKRNSKVQMAFRGVSGWGGKRRGAGRKNKSGEVAHAKRETVDYRTPLLLTLKLRDPRWNLRCGEVTAAFKRSAMGAKGFGLKILHFSLQKDHLHILVEAKNNKVLARGMRSFGARFGKSIRALVGGSGSVFKGRFHMRVITNPSQMRNALAYVLQNFSKHARLLRHVDRYSSAAYFTRWRDLLGRAAGPILDAIDSSRRSSDSRLPDYLCTPESWLAREGWRRARQPLATG